MGSNFLEGEDNGSLDGQLPEHEECLRILNLVLDGEASVEQREYFQKVIKNCMPYFEIYHLDKAIKDLIKAKCCGAEVPADLVDSIKSMISETAE